MILGKENQGKIRIKDIAERANVSIGTVDRVLHNRGEVKEETKKNVLSIVEEMGYIPNLLAKTLALKKKFRIAVIIPDTSDNNPYWERPLKGILEGAKEIEVYNTLVDIYTFNSTEETSFCTIFNMVLDSNPSGVIFNPVFKESSLNYVSQMDKLLIPYTYIDIDLEQGNNLAYFGQNAKQSGKVAAKIMSQVLPSNAKIAIVKLTNHKIITSHIKKREEGFVEFFEASKISSGEIISVDIDLSIGMEPSISLKKLFSENSDIKGVFVPSSRVFKVAGFLQEENIENILLMGFDLIDQNIHYLENEIIDFLISQKPEQQGYNSVMTLFNSILFKKEIKKVNYSSIDIIIKENIDHYNRN
jgi:LacI family transcriptional regulator